MKKIKLECWWSDTPSLNNRFIRQFVEDHEDYTFVSENPDFTIIFGRTDWEKIETPKDKTFYFSQEPLWSPNENRMNVHEFCSQIFISDKRDYPDRPEYIETLLPMFYAGRGESDHREEWEWSHKIKNKSFNKSKNTSLILRKDSYTHFNHLSNNITNKIMYDERTKFGIELSKNNLIDIYGTYWEKNDTNIKGEIWNKHVGLDEYSFSISCENTIQKNYISEKFWDVILTDGVPIYLGCSNIKDYIDDNCFIYLNDMTQEERISKINDVVYNYEKYYNLISENVKKLKKEFFTNSDFNLWEKIKKITS
jgi:hypothetical protein